jgi:hypothetical protein
MVDWRRINERYRKLTWEQRLGNLASTLSRSATASGNQRTHASVADLLREGMWIIEWTATDAPVDAQSELAAMQRELGLLRRAWEREPSAVQPLLAFRARAISDRALKLSGLLTE